MTDSTGNAIRRIARVRVPILVFGKRRPRTVWVDGRPTKIPGLFITPQFCGFDEGKKPKIDNAIYRLGTIDGYHCWDFKRLHEADKYVDQCLKIGLKDFRPKGRTARNMRVLNRNKNHPTVKKYFTMYHI